jgi:hypothetical protein
MNNTTLATLRTRATASAQSEPLLGLPSNNVPSAATSHRAFCRAATSVAMACDERSARALIDQRADRPQSLTLGVPFESCALVVADEPPDDRFGRLIT